MILADVLQFSNYRQEVWKILGFDEIQTHVSLVIVGVKYKLSYQATCWKQDNFERVHLLKWQTLEVA